ncbi:HIRAN domain-containing protein, partial [Pseudidiomarina sp. E22-M8]|uniref:HIRAN domain-containing protein n=1 Tax=Pseudidiomarina sp. E22-M8 TaxID=3424768 RepID=UPI00403CC6F7
MAKDALSKSSHLTIKGTRYYSAEGLFKKKSLRSGDTVELLHDENNPFDPWAVEVIHTRSKSKLGYLSRGVSKKYCQLLKQKKIVSSEITQAREQDGNLLISIIITANYQTPKLPSFIADTDNISAVYLIINNSCKRVYVGSSREVRSRLKSHFTDLSYGWHQNSLLQSDYQLSKLTDFKTVIIPVDDDKVKRERLEAEQIKSLLARKVHIYNMTED